MLYETQPDIFCSACLCSHATDNYKCLRGKIPGKLLGNVFEKENEIAFVCVCKTKELYH